ncbi:hypothetical protein BX667DRAFT_497821 [Coemansia mojavensis]|nr:hypothetical protein BX667DRAFT_497821 [Coemansia mojavensis]
MSLFQVLPIHVTCAIVNYILLFDTQPPLELDAKSCTINGNDACSLLQTNRGFRYSTLMCLLKWTSINISSKQLNVKAHLWPLPNIDYPMVAKHTRSLQINIDSKLLLDSSLKLDISKQQPVQFYAIKKLNIAIEDSGGLHDSLIAENCKMVLELIYKIVPWPVELKISYGKPTSCMRYENYCHVVNSSLSSMYHSVHPLYEANLLCIPEEIQPNSTSLSAINILESVNIEYTCQFIRSHSATLKKLKARFPVMKNCIGVFYDSDSKFVAYPNLVRLDIRADNHDHHSSLLDSPYKQLYPKLEYLFMEKLYPFANDTLLSKSADSLVYLRLGCNKQTMGMFKLSQAFAENAFAKLRHLALVQTPASSLYDIDVKDLVQFVFKMLPHVQKVELGGTKTYSDLFTTIADMKISANITELTIQLYKLTVNDIAIASQAFPQLESLNCLSISLGELSAVEGSLVDYVYTKLHFPNARLRTLKTWDVNQSIATQAYTFMLIAVMCPSFKVINMRRRRIAEFDKEIEALISKFSLFEIRPNLVVRNG